MYRYFVVKNQPLTPTTLLLTLQKGPKTKPFSFQPGQYAAISFKRKGRPTPTRCFSIVNPPNSHDIIQCSIRKNGRFTNVVSKLNEGDEVNITGPFGVFVFDTQRDRNMVLIAGGIGITPFMSMIQHATNNNLTNRITLIYNCSNQNDMPFLEQLIDIEKRNPYFKIIFTVSNGPTDRFINEDVKSGRITSEMLRSVVQGIYDDKTYFICGPPAFMNAMTTILYKSGVSEDDVITEAFGQGPDRKKGKAHNWPRNVYTLGAVGIVLAITAVMVTDLFTNLPVYSLLNSSNQKDLNATNGRQDELDKLVNGLPALNDDKPSSATVTKAASSSGNNTSSGQLITTSTPIQTITKTPTPSTKPAPVCTTTQSGVTTCV